MYIKIYINSNTFASYLHNGVEEPGFHLDLLNDRLPFRL